MKLDKSIVESCKAFAEMRTSSSSRLYKVRGEHKEGKIYEDALIGALGEWAVFLYLKELGHDISEPDMKLYKSKEKSYRHDLYTSKYNIHVKAQGYTSFMRYGHSWLMQRTDPLVSNPSHRDYLICCHVNLDEYEVIITGIIKALDISKNNLWGECRVPAYAKTKVALYMKDLASIDTWASLEL